MTYLADEASPEASQPREVIRIVMSLVEYRIATGTRDVVVNGKTYTAGTSARDEVAIASSKATGGVSIRLPITHPVVQRWLVSSASTGIVDVEILRKQVRSGEYRSLYRGRARSLAVQDDNTVASIEVVARHVALLDQKLPRVLVGRGCPLLLYGQECQANPNSFKVATTITALAGRDVTIATSLAALTWVVGGFLQHVASGERVLIYDQATLTKFMIRRPVYGMRVGDAVNIYAGCDHTLDVCVQRFANGANFGGFPDLPGANPHVPGGSGGYV